MRQGYSIGAVFIARCIPRPHDFFLPGAFPFGFICTDFYVSFPRVVGASLTLSSMNKIYRLKKKKQECLRHHISMVTS